MLVLLDAAGVPSVARVLRTGPALGINDCAVAAEVAGLVQGQPAPGHR